MKKVNIPYLDFEQDYPELTGISAGLDQLGIGNSISVVPWKTFPDGPDVRFNLAYGKQELFLKYSVVENYLIAEKTESNQAVYQDSCVEFFVEPEPGGPYMNFEFNCIGTCLAQTGPSRKDRLFLDTLLIKKIRRYSSLGKNRIPLKKGSFKWDLTVAVPFTLFLKKKPAKGDCFKANFYKCGDLLPEVHYLVWNNIESTVPDFHQPGFFGTIELQ